MNRQHRRKITSIVYLSFGLMLAAYLLLDAISDGMHLYQSPSELVNTSAGNVYIGGKVLEGSVHHKETQYQFSITDGDNTVPVIYKGTLPVMFKEGKDTVIRGEMVSGTVKAYQVLAKHDEYYQVEE